MEKSLADNEETTALDQEIPPPLLQPAANAPDPTRNDTSVTKVTAEHITTLDDKPEYMKGWRLYMLTAGIWITLFLSTLETTIVSTSLLSIADALSGFEERNWVVTAYFLTYTGMLCYSFPIMFWVGRDGVIADMPWQAFLSSTPNWPASLGPRLCSCSH